MTPNQIASEPIGLTRGGAVANRNELHRVARAERAQRAKRPFPILFRLVRIDRGGVEQSPRSVDDSHLDASTDTGVEPHRHSLPGGCGKQEIVQVGAEDANGFGLGPFAQRVLDLELEVDRHLELPGPSHRFTQPRVRRTSLVVDAECRGDPPLGHGRPHVPLGLRQHHRQAKDLFLATAEERQRAM
ncbi:MAG: hypothetical protein QM736_04350 [Vicinamibacterales bacterium]